METAERDETFESVKNRLAEIAEQVDDENLSLDDALDLYEEAVALGLKVSDLLEVGIEVADEAGEPDEPTDQGGLEEAAAASPEAVQEDSQPAQEASA